MIDCNWRKRAFAPFHPHGPQHRREKNKGPQLSNLLFLFIHMCVCALYFGALYGLCLPTRAVTYRNNCFISTFGRGKL